MRGMFYVGEKGLRSIHNPKSVQSSYISIWVAAGDLRGSIWAGNPILLKTTIAQAAFKASMGAWTVCRSLS